MEPPPPCCPPSLSALMEELVEEILLRIPPDEPAHLFRAALVCKPWRRILSDPGFLRRYRTLHRAPPLLGYFYNLAYGNPGPMPALVSTTAAPPPLSPRLTLDNDSGRCWVHDCRHGRVLIDSSDQLIVWDPITGDQKELSVPDYFCTYFAGAVLCAVDGCDHLDCHAGPFLVVYCGSLIVQHKTWASMYSSETGEWSSKVSIDNLDGYVDVRPTLLIGNALYFTLDSGSRMLKYDLGRHEFSVISLPRPLVPGVAVKLDDGGLGFISVLDNCIYRWSWQADANNDIGRWTQHMVMELETLLPRSIGNPRGVIGFVEGTDTIFINHCAGVFKLDLKLRKAKKLGKRLVYFYWILPYMSFYTPRSC